MTELFKGLNSCPNLKHLIVNDNWLKSKAATELELIAAKGKLELLNISDCNIG